MLNFLATILGYLMNLIYLVLAAIASFFTGGEVTVGNIGIAIILFTLIMYVAMLPLTYKQQKFSKLQARMQPEIKAIQEKYKNKKDSDSQIAMNQEVQAVYAKYGVSMSGSCVQMLLQMVILLPLYRVIYNIPKFVPAVMSVFSGLSDALLNTDGASTVLSSLTGAATFTSQIEEGLTSDLIAQILNKCSTADWETLSSWASSNSDLASLVNSTHSSVLQMNNFLGLNISDSPSYMFNHAIANGMSTATIIAIIAAIIVPVLAFVTQYLSVKLTTAMNPNSNSKNLDPNDPAVQMQQSMKVMNVTMPLFSAWICFTLPAGMGIYWIAAAVIRTILAIIVNHKIDKIDIDAMVESNKEKAAKKMEKLKANTPNISEYSSFYNRNLRSVRDEGNSKEINEEEINKRLDEVKALYDSGKARKDSLLYAANMVREYDKEHDKK